MFPPSLQVLFALAARHELTTGAGITCSARLPEPTSPTTEPTEYPWGKVTISHDGVVTHSTEIQLLTDEQVLEIAIRDWFPGYEKEDQVHQG